MPDNAPHTFTIKDMSFAAAIGIDWADKEHAVILQTPDSDKQEYKKITQSPEALEDWALELHQRFGEQKIAVAVELSRGPLIYALMKYTHLVIFPTPPAKIASYRKAFASSGAKDDPTDAALILDYLLKHGEHLRPWKPDDAQTRELDLLTRQRRKFVDQRTSMVNQLKSQLKNYFPQAIDLFDGDLTTATVADFLIKWTDLKSLKRARPETIRKFFYLHNVRSKTVIDERIKLIQKAKPLTNDPATIDFGMTTVKATAKMLKTLAPIIKEFDDKIKEMFVEHNDAKIFSGIPGGGPALAPRLLAGFGSDRNRFDSAQELQEFCGAAPVTKRSGQMCIVHRRLACPNFLRQTFHEFANHSRKKSTWAKAYYQMQRAKGKKHHTVIRSLAYKWIRILFACWKNHTPYDEAKYIAQLRKRNSSLCQYMQTAEN